MNKHNIGDTVFWFKYTDDYPEIRSFEVAFVRQNKKGYQYAAENPGCVYIPEDKLHATIQEAVSHGCEILEKLLEK